MFALASLQAHITANASWIDYLIIAIYFVATLGIGLSLRRRMKSSEDFFLSGRSLPSWVTGLAFVGANLGALEILGMGPMLPNMAFFRRTSIGLVPFPR